MNDLKKLLDKNMLFDVKDISPEFCEELFYYCFSRCDYIENNKSVFEWLLKKVKEIIS